MTSMELGEDWERTEVLHKKFEEFLADMEVRKERVNEVNQYANECAEVRWGITEPIQGKGSDLQEDCPAICRRDKKDILDIVRKQRYACPWSDMPRVAFSHF